MLKVNEIDVYYGDLPALRKVSFEVRQGEVVSVIGSNGAGKSTLLKAISGMLRLRHGTILLRSNDISQS
ncbi:MAG: ATP-binding cassette domain-containing protein, partial [Desulfobacterales bacterium]